MEKTKDLMELAKIVRSKNAGPFLFTFDILFDNFETYKRVNDSGVINEKLISKLYSLGDNKEISIVAFDAASAIKITFPRPVPSGSVGDSDVYGAQQHVPLYNVKIPWG